MRTVLICHSDAPVVREGMAAWLNSFSELAGVVVLKEAGDRRWKRIRREVKRVGLLRFLDVVAFQLHYRLTRANDDAVWTKSELDRIAEVYGSLPDDIPVHVDTSPNTPASRAFIEHAAPDIIIAGCKQILGRKTFSLAEHGTFVLHPGICPDYRNAHGGFWALANNDAVNVGMSLVKIDAGIDTGPVYGHFRRPFDGKTESHLRLQRRQTLHSLDDVRRVLECVVNGTAGPIDTVGRASDEYGQPWLSAYLRWKFGPARHAKRLGTESVVNLEGVDRAGTPLEELQPAR